jgi:hypothetical protein
MQKSNLLILHEGMNALKEKLGLVDSEKFISLILRENFDYTEWQTNLWKEKSLRDIHEEAKIYFERINS